MAAGISVLGMDPSLKNWGLAWGTYAPASRDLSINRVEVINPDYPTSKQVRQNSKDLIRAQGLGTGVLDAVKGAQAVFVEVPVGSQSARAMASYGICVGVLGLLRASGVPFFEVTPTEVKLTAVGDRTASKNKMIEWAVSLAPGANWPLNSNGGIVASKAEHMADAIGAIVAGIETNEFQRTLSFIQAA